MATLQHPTSVRNAIADAVVDLIDAGSGAGKLEFYTSNTGTNLATLTLSDPAFGPGVNGVATANTITSNTNTGSGTVTWFKVVDSDDNIVFEGDVTDDDTGTGSIQLSSVALGTGDTVSVSALTYTAPN